MLQVLRKLNSAIVISVRRFGFSQKQRMLLKENTVLVEKIPEKNRLGLYLLYQSGPNMGKKSIHVNRDSDESYLQTCERLAQKIEQIHKKRKIDECVSIKVIGVDPSTEDSKPSCEEVFTNGNYSLQVGSTVYNFDINPPRVTSVALPPVNLAGSLLVTSKLELHNCSKEDLNYQWHRSIKPVSHFPVHLQDDQWEFVSNQEIVETSVEDVGKCYKLTVSAGSGSQGYVEQCFSNPLVKGPDKCPFSNRHQYTTSPLGHDSFRIVSYNTLADCYAKTSHAQNNLFASCPPEALDIHYRRSLIANELLGYNADIICLQEIDEKVHESFLSPVFSSKGFNTFYKRKSTDNVREGLLTMYRKDKFRELSKYQYTLGDELDLRHSLANLKKGLSRNKNLLDNMLTRNTVFQVTVLESIADPSQIVVVGNVHLYAKPIADHIRLLQTFVCLKIVKEILKQYEDSQARVLFVGDFNSIPENAVYRFFIGKRITEYDPDWKSDPQEEVHGLEIEHSMNICSAYENIPYTNYVKDFQACLDYIFYDKTNLELLQTVPLPPHELVTQHEYLPSVTVPSDHLALIADFRWKKSDPSDSGE